MTPIGMASSKATLTASREISSDTFIRWTIAGSTGSRVHNEVPKSPRAACATHVTYCTANGLSMPSSLRICWSVSAGTNPLSATRAITASPGIILTSEKITNETNSNDGIANNKRWAMYRVIESFAFRYGRCRLGGGGGTARSNYFSVQMFPTNWALL